VTLQVGLFFFFVIIYSKAISADMPTITGDWENIAPGNRLLHEQQDYNREELAATVTHNVGLFNNAQKSVYEAVMESINGNQGKLLFLHSAGGCGKTFVCNTIAAAVRAQGKIALCVASSGIASQLLEGGRTAHSTFKIPLQVDETSTCNIRRNTHRHDLLKQTAVIIWDEVPMQHKYAVEAVDRTLRDLLGKDVPFGGITVIFGGDFRQTLPVIPKGTRQETVSASLRKSSLWRHIDVHYLQQNMRLEQSPESAAFANWLLEIGAGSTVDEVETVPIPENMVCQDNTMDSLIASVYPGIGQGRKEDQYFLDRAILSCTNDHVARINEELLAKFPGQQQMLLSADSVHFEDDAMNEYQPYSVEYLNSLTSSSLPLAHLALKPGCPVMLLRNLDPSKGLCNGTRLVVLEIRRRVLWCRIISGDRRFAGKKVFIPRITLEPSAEDLPLPLRRRQFPVRLAFAMTVNKSQGQSLQHVGLNLESPVFSHGQLYVGLSRCTSGERIKVLFNEDNNGRTPNIVYKEALGGLRL
jgi:hypothetical protein